MSTSPVRLESNGQPEQKETLLIWRSGASAQRYYLLGGLFDIIAPSGLYVFPRFKSRLLLGHDHFRGRGITRASDLVTRAGG